MRKILLLPLLAALAATASCAKATAAPQHAPCAALDAAASETADATPAFVSCQAKTVGPASAAAMA